MPNDDQQYEEIEEKILRKEVKRTKKMHVSGKSVLKLQRIIKDRVRVKSQRDNDKS